MAQHFDIRITGEVDDATALARAVVSKVALMGARINHASLDGREVRVAVEADEPGIAAEPAIAEVGIKLDEKKGE